MPPLETDVTAATAAGNGNGAAAAGSATAGSASVSLPPWVDSQLGKERAESLKSDTQKDSVLLKDVAGFKSLPEVFDAWRTQRTSLQGTVRLPKEGDGKEVWDQFYKGIGRPESPDKYAYERPKLPEGMVYNEQEENWFRTLAHGLGLTQNQVKGILDGVNRARIEGFTNYQKTASEKKAADDKTKADAKQKALSDAQADLKQTWGNEFPQRMKAVSEAILKFPKTIVDKMDAAGLLLDTGFMKFMDGYVRATKEDNALGLASEGGTGTEESVDERGIHKLRIHVAKARK